MTAETALPGDFSEKSKRSPKTLADLAKAYFANLGRAPVDGEGEEFKRAFEAAEIPLLRRAIDAYFGANPDFPKIPGLRAAYTRVAEAVDAERRAHAPKPAPSGPTLAPDEIKAAVRGGGWTPSADVRPLPSAMAELGQRLAPGLYMPKPEAEFERLRTEALARLRAADNGLGGER